MFTILHSSIALRCEPDRQTDAQTKALTAEVLHRGAALGSESHFLTAGMVRSILAIDSVSNFQLAEI